MPEDINKKEKTLAYVPEEDAVWYGIKKNNGRVSPWGKAEVTTETLFATFEYLVNRPNFKEYAQSGYKFTDSDGNQFSLILFADAAYEIKQKG